MSHRDTSWKTSALGLLKQKNLFISHPKYIIILPTKKYGRVFKSFNLGNIKMMRTAKAKKKVFLKRFIVAEIGSPFNSFQYGPNNVQVDNTNFQNQLKKV